MNDPQLVKRNMEFMGMQLDDLVDAQVKFGHSFNDMAVLKDDIEKKLKPNSNQYHHKLSTGINNELDFYKSFLNEVANYADVFYGDDSETAKRYQMISESMFFEYIKKLSDE